MEKQKIGLSSKLISSIENRWSGRSFSNQMIEESHLNALMEAARWAPSCYNEQPWRFMIAKRGTDLYQSFYDTLSEGNQAWAGDAPILLLALARKEFRHNGHENIHSWHDVGLAMGQLGMQATELGINLHQMAGFDRARLTVKLSLPDSYEAVSITAVGYRDEADKLEGIWLEKEKAPQSRLERDQIIIENINDLS